MRARGERMRREVESRRRAREQWILVTRGHWAVENNCHHTWDAVLMEDDDEDGWMECEGDCNDNDGPAMIPMAMLLLALFRRRRR